MTNLHDHKHPEHPEHPEQSLEERYGQAAWDARYSESDRLWSGNPNPRLVEHINAIEPGTVLDVGAGEGADAVWLARQGWQVTALDVSPVALARTRQHALDAGVSVTTQQHDLLSNDPLPGTYDLVSAQFWHPPLERFTDFRDVIGAAVRPGGLLLVVGHHPDDLPTGLRDGHGHEKLLFTPDQVVSLLDPDEWDVQVSAAQTREVDHPDGHVTATDSVVLARRR